MFKDNFSKQAAAYAHYRPHYPVELFSYLASLAQRRDRAWDCATGNGQAATGLSCHFQQIIATDLSSSQLEKALPANNVSYALASAENCGLPSDSVDLVTVAQAVHWFDIKAFYREVKRVCKNEGVLALWSYGLPQVNPKVDEVLRHYCDFVNSCAGAQVQNGQQSLSYASLHFPFEELSSPCFEMNTHWQLEDVLGYLETLSATQKSRESLHYDPVEAIRKEMTRNWGRCPKPKAVHWKLGMRLGRIKKKGLLHVL